jgi:spore maturation protein CgeB
MRILLVDTTQYYPSSPLFLEALEELSREEGHEFNFFDQAPYFKLLERSLFHRVANRLLAGRPLTYWKFNKELIKAARLFRPNLLLIIKGALVSPKTLQQIKRDTRAVLVNYATDDPFNPRVTTRDLKDGISYYDFYACTKRAIMADIKKAGCWDVAFVPFGYKRTVHFPEMPGTPGEKASFVSDVVFIGGCDVDRIPYFEALLKALPNLQLHLYGGYWDRHPILQEYHRGFALGRDYRLALNGAKIALNIVRRANRDGHVMRTFEVPACGAFVLAERTEEHLEYFEENKEAAYFNSEEELVDKVRYYLAHDAERERISQAGYKKVISGGHTYLHRLRKILDHVKSIILERAS